MSPTSDFLVKLRLPSKSGRRGLHGLSFEKNASIWGDGRIYGQSTLGDWIADLADFADCDGHAIPGGEGEIIRRNNSSSRQQHGAVEKAIFPS